MLGFKSLCVAAAVAIVGIPAATAFAGGCGSSEVSFGVHIDIGNRNYGPGYRAPVNYGRSDRHIDVHRHYDRDRGHIDRHTVKSIETIQHGRPGYDDRRYGYSTPRGYRYGSRGGCR